MKGRIIKGIGGFYYVYTSEGLYTCKAKGVFRKDGKKPLVGDYVEMAIVPNEDMVGNIEDILPRSNFLIRPNVANVDQALIVFALKNPDPNFITLDKMILQYKLQNIPVIICFNKEDLVSKTYGNDVMKEYDKCGCQIFITSTVDGEGINELKAALNGKTTAVAGPSGAGKSSLVNCLSDGTVMETGEISAKLSRGKHTTRHSEIIPICEETYIMDTPGFSSFDIMGIKENELADYYSEFDDIDGCRFMPCSHTHEPDCAVKAAVNSKEISENRYNNYVYIYEELGKGRKY